MSNAATDKLIRDAVDDALGEVRTELVKIIDKHGPFRTLHEAYGVLMEEVEEFWDEVKRKGHQRDFYRIREELIQVAAVALKTAASFTGRRSDPINTVTPPLAQAKNTRERLVEEFYKPEVWGDGDGGLRSAAPLFMAYVQHVANEQTHPLRAVASTYLQLLNSPEML